VAAVDAGMKPSEAAVRFDVSVRTVERYLARRRISGSLAPDVPGLVQSPRTCG
jgi:transposase